MAVITGTATADNLLGTTGADMIVGLGGNDLLNGGRGNDRLEGGAGADVLVWDQDPLSRGRVDVYVGGSIEERYEANIYGALRGGDRLHLNGSSRFTVNFNHSENGSATDAWGNRVNFVGIERLQTGSGADRISAAGAVLNGNRGSGGSFTPTHGLTINSGAGNDCIVGSRGSDVLDPGSGNDTVYGGGGLDLLMPSEGNDYGHAGDGDDNVRWGNNGSMGPIHNIGRDTLAGGAGHDLLNVWAKGNGDNSTGSTIVFISASAGRAHYPQGGGTLFFSEFEQFWAHEGRDTVAGGDAAVGLGRKGIQINTRWGDDYITATRGNDTVEGGIGADTIDGRQGDDLISMCDGVFEARLVPPDAQRDVLIIRDGCGEDTIRGFQAGDLRDGGGNIIRHSDALSVVALHDRHGYRVNLNDVRVGSDDGNATLSFPNGERIILEGVSAGTLTRAMLVKLGIPAAPAPTSRAAGPDEGAATLPAGGARDDTDQFRWRLDWPQTVPATADHRAAGDLSELVAVHRQSAALDAGGLHPAFAAQLGLDWD